MNITGKSETAVGDNRTLFYLTAGLLLFIMPALYLFITGRVLYVGFYMAVPVMVLLVSSRRVSFYIFIASLFVYMPYRMNLMAIHPWDLTAALFLGACLIDALLKFKTDFDKTVFDLPLIALIIVAIISGIFAYDRTLSIVPIARLVLIYIIYRALYYLTGQMKMKTMINAFVVSHVAFSLYNLSMFFMYGGAMRIFGISGIAFETLSMAGIPIALAMAIWSRKSSERTIYTIAFLIVTGAGIATMSRGLILTIIIAFAVFLIASFRKAKLPEFRSARKFAGSLLYIGIPIIMLIIINSGTFAALLERFETITFERATGTILLRFELWRAALEAFMMDPLTGIGIGNYKAIFEILPDMRFNPYIYYLIGYSTHNVLLQELSELGIFGGVVILYFGWTALRTGIRLFRENLSEELMPMIAAAFTTTFVFFITIFYMRAWLWGQEGYTLAFILALTARLANYSIEKRAADHAE